MGTVRVTLPLRRIDTVPETWPELGSTRTDTRSRQALTHEK